MPISVLMMEKLPQHELYSSYSYHVALLKDFSEVGAEDSDRNTVGSGRRASTAMASARTSNIHRSSSILGTKSTLSSSSGTTEKKRGVQRAQSVAVY
jgi:hypothetical protein